MHAARSAATDRSLGKDSLRMASQDIMSAAAAAVVICRATAVFLCSANKAEGGFRGSECEIYLPYEPTYPKFDPFWGKILVNLNIRIFYKSFRVLYN